MGTYHTEMATCHVLLLLFVLLSDVRTLVSAQESNTTSPWKTLSGAAPLVIARGGFSGLFPDSSSLAYQFAKTVSLPNTVLWCDVQLTKDAIGICLPNLLLDNITSIQGPGANVYTVDGVPTSGHFSVDYTFNDLTKNTAVTQDRPYRSFRFYGGSVLTIDDVAKISNGTGLWVNVQHDKFFTQRNLSMRSYVLSVSRRITIDYISSPEVDFLRGILAQYEGSKTKFIFRFLERGRIEPSTNLTYGSLLKNLTFIKTFCSGIMIPKDYILPLTHQSYTPIPEDNALGNIPSPTITSPRSTRGTVAQYLLPHTSIVTDAHEEGLEVFPSDFSNDFDFSYNYSYDPVDEFLHFIDKYNFSVDGVLSDFPITASEAIDCFSNIQNISIQAKPKIMTHNGASGVYPGSTDRAFLQAFNDGADYIDCSVQMTKDEIPVCLSSINLLDFTSIANSPFSGLASVVQEIQINPGIFTFDLMWNDIQSLTPLISNPERVFNLSRNPAYASTGAFMRLDDFLTFAHSKPIIGIVIRVENAAYLAKAKGMNIIGSITDALKKSGYDNHQTQEVIIQSTSRAVLTHFNQQPNYSRMYKIMRDISDADDSSIKDIKSFADYVAVSKESVFPTNHLYIIGNTSIVSRLQLFNLTVYVYLFRNEFVAQAWDFFCDAIIEINSFVMIADIDGIITEFPKTAATYRRNKCISMGDNTPPYMLHVEPGFLTSLMSPDHLMTEEDPNPILTEKDVAEEPLPPVSKQVPNHGGSPPASSTSSLLITPRLMLCIFLSFMSSLFGGFLAH